MQRIFSLGVYAPIRYIIIAVLVLSGCQIMYGQQTKTDQKPGRKSGNKAYPKPTIVQTASWNILFKEKSTYKTREVAIKKIQDALKLYYRPYPLIKPDFHLSVYC